MKRPAVAAGVPANLVCTATAVMMQTRMTRITTGAVMTHTSTCVAFAASDRLHQTSDSFIQRMRNSCARTEPETIDAIMAMFLNEALTAFMITPAEKATLSPTLMRIILFTTETINKAARMVIRSTARKLNVAQNRDIAEYMDKVRYVIDDQWHICLPIDDITADKARTGFALAMDGQHTSATPLMQEYFHRVTDIALKWYFEDPVALLRLGPVLRRLAEVGVATTRKATHTMIDNVIPRLTDEQARVASEYCLTMIKELPASKTSA